MKKIIFTSVFFLLSIISSLKAQDINNPWQFSIGTNMVDTYTFAEFPSAELGEKDGYLKDFLSTGDWNYGGFSFLLSRFIKGGISIGIEVSTSRITEITGLSDIDFPFYSFNNFIKYSPLDKAKLSPYVYVGYGISYFDTSSFSSTNLLDKGSNTIFLGAGINYNINDKVGVFMSLGYRNALNQLRLNHFQHQLGINYNFNFNKNKALETSDEYGNLENKGVSEIKIKKKKLKRGAETLEIKNSSKRRSKRKRSNREYENLETTESFDARLYNDNDGDGIDNADDKCPEIYGNIANEGCPEVSKPNVEMLNSFAYKIIFPSESADILGRQNQENLSNIIEILVKNPSGQLLIEGFSSSDGNEGYNQNLSKQRAISVRNYLINKGIDADRLEAVGLGEKYPIDDTVSESDRANNRFVQFKVMF